MVINMSVGNGLKFKMIPTIRNLFFTPGGDIHYIGGSEVLPPPLDPAQEAEVLKRLGTEREEEAKSILIEHNLRLVVYIAKKFENTGVGVEDLISIGTIGLIKAINTYNKEKNIKLATYASRCIENEILMYLRRNNKTKMEVSIDEPLFSFYLSLHFHQSYHFLTFLMLHRPWLHQMQAELLSVPHSVFPEPAQPV